MPINDLEVELSGGHPNSLGNTDAVAQRVLADRTQLDALFDCYASEDAVVRLRVSSALKRVSSARPEWLVPYLDELLTTVASLDQASAQWTLATLLDGLRGWMTPAQHASAVQAMQRNLDENDDWIVQNTTMQVLAEWSTTDADLADWLHPRLTLLADSHRKSVAGRARKLLAARRHESPEPLT